MVDLTHAGSLFHILYCNVTVKGYNVFMDNFRTIISSYIKTKLKSTRKKQGSYEHHKEIRAAQGIKISAQGLEHAVAGTAFYVVKTCDDLEALKEATMRDMNDIKSGINKTGGGVFVQAPEALGDFVELCNYFGAQIRICIN